MFECYVWCIQIHDRWAIDNTVCGSVLCLTMDTHMFWWHVIVLSILSIKYLVVSCILFCQPPDVLLQSTKFDHVAGLTPVFKIVTTPSFLKLETNTSRTVLGAHYAKLPALYLYYFKPKWSKMACEYLLENHPVVLLQQIKDMMTQIPMLGSWARCHVL